MKFNQDKAKILGYFFHFFNVGFIVMTELVSYWIKNLISWPSSVNNIEPVNHD